MSLVGAEVDISGEASEPFTPRLDILDEEPDDLHPPVSPARPVEKLFFGSQLSESTQTVSATALANQIHMQHASSGLSLVSNFSDFQSAMGETHFFSSMDCMASISERFSRDALGNLPDSTFSETQQEDMTTTTTTTNKVDAAAVTYDTAKKVWGWGKEQAILSPFLGMAEAVASKALTTTGVAPDLESADRSINTQIKDLDDGVLNPAIAKLLEILSHVADKSSGMVKPIIDTVLKPLLKDKPENPELTTVSKPAGLAGR